MSTSFLYFRLANSFCNEQLIVILIHVYFVAPNCRAIKHPGLEISRERSYRSRGVPATLKSRERFIVPAGQILKIYQNVNKQFRGFD